MSFKGRTILITGASRGIGRETAIRCAQAGANIVVTGKSVQEGKLPGTIFSVAKEVEVAGGKALPIEVDVRNENQIEAMVQKTIEHFGRLDVLIHNAGTVQLTSVEETLPKRMDLMLDINLRAALLCSHFCIPHLKKQGGHILFLSPPLTTDPKWYGRHAPYTITKMGMSLATLGLAEELKEYKISVNSIWPRTLIWTAAVEMLLGPDGKLKSRHPKIVADAIYEILKTAPGTMTGKHLIDEDFLKEKGVTDFTKYNAAPNATPMLDLYIESV